MTKENNLIDYVLFTRIKRGDDLIQVGSFKAVSNELAEIYAQHIYDEEDWVEMQIVPKDAMICIRKPEPLFK
ncbi:hypothetical protein [Metabacillus sediminilitoris]|jgi:hypothetical protein|uniref:Phenylacetic acid degradation B n=1 Tax=Metabacillus sediminilitoris TaxID=2567941 RepID=A0A4S4BW63_9BACI|nr:hypothetical protein [Metabacillus sediminilitoris]QGQ46345.1 hypothetical protein GMB29_14630 [Metabacillus sediminilitoris]THF79395.1 hypothetical protein E6W99_13735 [Metabacillus sediminilitoris]